MGATHVQTLGSNQSKTAGTSLVISPASKTVTVGNVIFVAYGGDDVGSAFGIIDNLGNTYTLVKETVQAGEAKAQLWSAPVTTGGSITSITISWTTNVTAKAAVAGEFGNVGTLRLTDGVGGAGAAASAISNQTFFTGELWVGACAIEDDVVPTSSGSTGSPAQTKANDGGDGTTGGGSASNMSVCLGYILINADSSSNGYLDGVATGTSQDSAGAGAIYNARGPLLPTGKPSGQSGQRFMHQVIGR